MDRGWVTDPATGRRRRKQSWVTFHGTADEADDRLAELVKAERRGEFIDPSKLTVGEWLAEWSTKCIAPTKRRRTVKMYEVMIRTQLVPALGAIPVQRLKPSDIQKYIADATTNGYAPATIRMHLAILSGALTQAVTDNLVPRNVVAGVKKPKVQRPEHRVKANTWTATDARTFLAEAAKHGPMVYAYYATALSTGARRSELAGLQWDAVDFDRGLITIMQELDLPEGDDTHATAFGPTKTNTTRVINIGHVVKLLRAHRRHQNEVKMKCGRADNYEDHDLVFCREHEHLTDAWHKLGQPMYVDGLGPGRMERLIKLAGVKHISPHGLRDTCASLLSQDGTPVKVIAERLGHARATMTLERYIAVLPGMQESAGKQLNALLHG